MGLRDTVKGAVWKGKEEDPEERHERDQQTVREMWDWLMTHYDPSVSQYLHNGRDDGLRRVLAGEALEETLRYLDELRALRVEWEYADRERLDQRDLRLLKVIGNTFVVQVFYRDHSTMRWYVGEQMMEERRASGAEVSLRAIITVDRSQGSDEYYITKLTDESASV